MNRCKPGTMKRFEPRPSLAVCLLPFLHKCLSRCCVSTHEAFPIPYGHDPYKFISTSRNSVSNISLTFSPDCALVSKKRHPFFVAQSRPSFSLITRPLGTSILFPQTTMTTFLAPYFVDSKSQESSFSNDFRECIS